MALLTYSNYASISVRRQFTYSITAFFIFLWIETTDVLKNACCRSRFVALVHGISINFQFFFSCISLRHFAWECLLYSEVSKTAAHHVFTCAAVHELIGWTSIFLNLHNLSDIIILIFSSVIARTFLFRSCRVSGTTLVRWSSRGSPRSRLPWRVLWYFFFLTLFVCNLAGKQFTASDFVSDLKYLSFQHSFLFLTHFHEIVGFWSDLVFASRTSIVLKRLENALTTNLLLIIF